MSEINPNHPVTREVHDHWHKIVAILLHKFGYKELRITMADLQACERDFPDGAVVIKANNDDFLLWLITADEARELAKREGGLPQ
jgi:hypothetical protein